MAKKKSTKTQKIPPLMPKMIADDLKRIGALPRSSQKRKKKK